MDYAGEAGAPLAVAAAPAVKTQRQGYSESLLKRITGAAKRHFDTRKTRDDKLRDGFFKERSDNLNDTTNQSRRVNFFFPFVTTLLGILYAKAPEIQVEPVDGAGGGQDFLQALWAAGVLTEPTIGAARRFYAETAEAVAEFTFKNADGDDHTGQVIQEALVTGLGIAKHSFDPELGFDRADCLQAHEIYFDPAARFNLKQCRYIVHRSILPVEEAREFFSRKVEELKQLEAQSGPQAVGIFNLKPEFDPASLEGNSELPDADPFREGGADGKEYFAFDEIWCNEGQNGCWVYYVSDALTVDFRMPWPFTLRTYDYPFSILAFNRVGKSLNDAFSDQAVIEGLREIHQRFADFMLKLVERSIAKKVLYNPKFLDSEEAKKIKAAGNELALVALQNVPQDMPLDKIFHLLNLNQGDEVLVEVMADVKKWIDEITGNDELLRGAQTNDMTAEEARIRQDMSMVRVGRRHKQIDTFLSDMTTKRLCIARQKVNPQLVQKIAGDAAATCWELDAEDPNIFLMVYDVSVGAGSTAKQDKQYEIDNLDKVIQKMTGANQLASQMQMPPPFDVIEAIKAQLSKLERNVGRFEIKEGEQAGGAMGQQGAPMQAQQGQQIQQNGPAGGGLSSGLPPPTVQAGHATSPAGPVTQGAAR